VNIIKTAPYSIEIGKDNLTLKIYGESFVRGYGSPDFIIDTSKIKHWTDKVSGLNYAIDDNEASEIINYVLITLRQRGWNIEAE